MGQINNDVPSSRQIIAGANVTINGGASSTLASDITVAATGGGGGGGYIGGCLCKLSANIIGVNASAGYNVGLDGANIYDDFGLHNSVTNNSKIIIPIGTGATRAQLYGTYSLNNVTNTSTLAVNFF